MIRGIEVVSQSGFCGQPQLNLKRTAFAALFALIIFAPASASVINLSTSAYNFPGYPGNTYPGLDAKQTSNYSGPSSSLASSYLSPVGQADAKSYADITTGKIGVSSYSDGFAVGIADSYYYETINFLIPGVSSSTDTLIGFSIRYDGTLTNSILPGYIVNGLPVYGSSSNLLDFNFGTGIGTGQYQLTNSMSDNILTSIPFLNGFQSASFVGSPTNFVANFTINVRGANPIAFLSLRMRSASARPASSDFYNTAGFSFNLPSNVTWTSGSGNFLTNVESAVPEPSTWLLLVSGFGIIGTALRSKSKGNRFEIGSAARS